MEFKKTHQIWLCTILVFILTINSKQTFAQLGWFLLQSGTQQNIWSMTFIGNSNTGYCAGYNGMLVKTTNGGTNWVLLQTGTNYWLKCIHFPNENTGYIAGNTGVIVKTTNSGVNWILYPAGTVNVQNSIYFVNSETGYVSTATGEILKTTNGAVSWTSTQPVTGNINSIYFLNSITGYFAGSAYFGGTFPQGIIFKTTNSGFEWDTVLITGGIFALFKVYFPSVNTGYAVGSPGLIVKTTTAGIIWNFQTSNTTKYLTSVYFLNDNTGYAVGQDGTILKTSNGGNIWVIQQNLATNYILRDVRFTDVMTGYAAGDNGTIIKTTTGGEPLGLEPNQTKIPQCFFLYQNYPNPFNPVTKIRFSIPLNKGRERGLSVNLNIYDILGREVATLVNEQLNPGTYEVEWDGTNYPGGVYFYILQTNLFKQTKRMVFIK